MTKRMLPAALVAAALIFVSAAAAPRAEALGFVDKQVQAGGLLIQNYVNAYGMKHGFVFPAVSQVRKGGGLEDKTRIWPSNPWTGKTMKPGKSRGTYTYKLRNDGTAYTLTMHFSKGKYAFTGAMPKWLKTERDTTSRQNMLLLQRYLDAYKGDHGDYPATELFTAATFSGYSWPENPWTGNAMVAGSSLGDYSYTYVSASSFTLKVRLTSGWSTAVGPLSLVSSLATTPTE